MYYGRIWLRVNPAVGIPLIIGAAATAAMITHIGILTHTTWFPAFLEGGAKSRPAMSSSAAVVNTPGGAQGAASVVINVAPK